MENLCECTINIMKCLPQYVSISATGAAEELSDMCKCTQQDMFVQTCSVMEGGCFVCTQPILQCTHLLHDCVELLCRGLYNNIIKQLTLYVHNTASNTYGSTCTHCLHGILPACYDNNIIVILYCSYVSTCTVTCICLLARWCKLTQMFLILSLSLSLSLSLHHLP